MSHINENRRKFEDNLPKTLLDDNWKFLCMYVLGTYVCTVWLLWFNFHDFDCKIVYDGSKFLSDSVIEKIQFMVFGVNITYSILQIFRMILAFSNSRSFSLISAHSTMFTIFGVSVITEYLIISDFFGNRTSSWLYWADWQITLPFVIYLTIILDVNKKSLLRQDYITIFSSWIGLVCGLLLSTKAFPKSILILIIAFISYIYSSFVMVSNVRHCIIFQKKENYIQFGNKPLTPFLQIVSMINERRYVYSICLAVLIVLLPLVYLLLVSQWIAYELFSIIMFVMNFIMKVFYAVSLMESHIEVLNPNTFQLLVEENANETRRSFLRYVFHEVRVPLNSITLGLHLLEENTFFQEHDIETIHMMKEATSFMTETLNDVLSIQKIEEGKLELHFEKFSVQEMVQTVATSFRGQLSSKDITLIIKIDEIVPQSIKGDRFRLEHVLANFLSNAIKFSPINAQISIIVSFNTKASDWITFSVLDEGPGISADDQKNLFVPYMQIRPGELQKGKGTGVGLAICKEIIALHNGDIGCRSLVNIKDGKLTGSEFYFSIFVEAYDSHDSKDKHGLRTGMVDSEGRAKTMHRDSSFDFSIDEEEVDEDSSELSDHASKHGDDGPRVSRRHLISPHHMEESSNKPSSVVVGVGVVDDPVELNKDSGIKKHEFAIGSVEYLSSSTTIEEAQSSSSKSGRYDRTERKRPTMESQFSSPMTSTSLSSKTSMSEDNSVLRRLRMASTSSINESEEIFDYNFTVLIVDDVLSNRKMLHLLLQRKGVHDCKMVSDGQEAIDIVEQEPDYFNLIFM